MERKSSLVREILHPRSQWRGKHSHPNSKHLHRHSLDTARLTSRERSNAIDARHGDTFPTTAPQPQGNQWYLASQRHSIVE